MVKGKSSEGRKKPRRTKAKYPAMEAVRRTVKKLGYDVKTQTAKDYILKEFGKDLTNNKISAYKSNIRREAGLTRTRGAHSNGTRGGRRRRRSPGGRHSSRQGIGGAPRREQGTRIDRRISFLSGSG